MTTIGLSYSLVKRSTKCAPALAVRRGLRSAEMAAYAALNEEELMSRRKLHRGFLKIRPYLVSGSIGESLNELDLRVKSAIFQQNAK